jgi:hypothetical protein
MLRLGERCHISALYQCKLISGILAWTGIDIPFVHVSIPTGSPNNFCNALLELFHSTSNNKWVSKLHPMNDLEIVKSKSISPFVIAGSKKSILLDEGFQLSQEITRNILVFAMGKKKQFFGDISQNSELVLTVKDAMEKTVQLATEIQNLKGKIADVGNVTIDEINEVENIKLDLQIS